MELGQIMSGLISIGGTAGVILLARFWHIGFWSKRRTIIALLGMQTLAFIIQFVIDQNWQDLNHWVGVVVFQHTLFLGTLEVCRRYKQKRKNKEFVY